MMSFRQTAAEEKSTKRSALLKKLQDAFSEQPIEPIEVEPSTLRRWTRRDLLLFGAGAPPHWQFADRNCPQRVARAGPRSRWHDRT